MRVSAKLVVAVMKALGLLAVAAVLGCVPAGGGGAAGGASGGPTPATPKADGPLTREQVTAFADAVGSFKGKTVKLKAKVDSSIHARDGKSLREFAGKAVRFRVYGNSSAHEIHLVMPSGGLPDAHYLDELVITFVCKEGDLKKGNEATKVERP